MSRRWWVRLGGGATAALAVAVGVATNQVLDNGRLSWPWLGSALAIAVLTVVLDRWMARTPDSDLELSAVTLTQTGPPQDSSAVLDLKLRNIGGQPAILHRATFHIHDAVSLSPYYLVGFLPYEEVFLRGMLSVSETYAIALPEPEEAAGSHHNLDLSQAIEPAGTDRFHIQLGIPPTQDTLIYLLHFDIHYDARRALSSPAIAIAHPPGSRLVTPDEIRSDLHLFRQAVRNVRDATDLEMTSRGLPPPDWDNHPPTSRADLPPSLLSIDGDPRDPLSAFGAANPAQGIYEVTDAFWNPNKSLTQRLHDIHDYCTRIVNIITGADINHDSLPSTLAEAQAILDELPALEAEFSTAETVITVQDHAPSGTLDAAVELARLLGGLEELHARANAGEQDAARQLNTAIGLVQEVRWRDPVHPEALNARETLIFWLVAWDKPGAAAALIRLIPDQARVHGPNHPRVLQARHFLAMCHGETGNAAGAAAAYAELVNDRIRVLGVDHLDTFSSRHEQLRWRAMAGDPAGAAKAFANLIADMTRALGPDHRHTLSARRNKATCRGKAGDPASAAAELAELVAHMERVLGTDDPDTLSCQDELARWRRIAGNPDGEA